MEIRGLMIGDWVLYKDEPITVFEIDEYYDRINTEPDGYNAIRCIEASEIKPIPLTPEILEKNGFIGGEYKSYTGYVWYLEEKGFSKIWFIMSCEKSILCGEKIKTNGSIGDNFSIPNIKFVHELQHALRICGIDKEIQI